MRNSGLSSLLPTLPSSFTLTVTVSHPSSSTPNRSNRYYNFSDVVKWQLSEKDTSLHMGQDEWTPLSVPPLSVQQGLYIITADNVDSKITYCYGMFHIL